MPRRDTPLRATRLMASGLALCQLAVVGYAIPATFGLSVGTGIAAAVVRLALPAGVALVVVGARRTARDGSRA